MNDRNTFLVYFSSNDSWNIWMFIINRIIIYVRHENYIFKRYLQWRQKKATQNIVIFYPKNQDSLVAKFFSYTRSLLVTLYF